MADQKSEPNPQGEPSFPIGTPTTDAHPNQSRPTNLSADWSEDTFPTSAKGVFLWAGVMFGGILLLCLYVWSTSEKMPDKKVSDKKSAAEQSVKSLTDKDDDE